MTTLTTTSTVSLTISEPVRPQLWRVLHDVEMGAMWREGLPEVFWFDELATPMTKQLQIFTKALNPEMDPLRWRALYSHDRAFTNKNNGYDYPGGSVKQDWVNMRNVTALDVPKFDKTRVCGGALLAGMVDGVYLWAEYIDANLPLPPIETLPIWLKFCATTCAGEHEIGRFPQGDGLNVWIPLIARQPIKYPLAKLQRVTGAIPSPYWVP